jgi:hypothetical protein
VLARTDNRDAARRGGVLDREALDQEELPIELVEGGAINGRPDA